MRNWFKQRFNLGPDYLMFWSGQTISYIGDSLAGVALSILLLKQGASATQLALIGLAGSVPLTVFGLIAVAVVDRFRRRHILIFCDVLRGLLTVGIAVLATRGSASIVAYAVWIAALSATRAFYQPVTMAIVPALIAPERLAQASAAQSIGMALPGLAGPALAALLIEVAGPWLAFTLDALSFLISACLIWRITTRYEPDLPHRSGSVGAGIVDGLRFFLRTPLALGLITATVIINGVNTGTGVPTQIHIVRTLGGSPANLALVYSLGSALYLLASSVIIAKQKWRSYGLMLITGLTVSGVVLISCTLTGAPLVASVILALNSLVGPLYGTSIFVLYQQITPADLRGRVFAIRSTVSVIMIPLAQYLSGPSVDRFGSAATLRVLGGILLLAAMAALLWPTMRRAGLAAASGASGEQQPAAS